jgi:MaoC like domain
MTTRGRTVSEADIITLAGISGDWNPLHIDEEFSKNAGYGGRIAHGPMSMSVAIGLMAQQNLIDGTALALLGLHRLRQRHRAAEICLRILLGQDVEHLLAVRPPVLFEVHQEPHRQTLDDLPAMEQQRL